MGLIINVNLMLLGVSLATVKSSNELPSSRVDRSDPSFVNENMMVLVRLLNFCCRVQT